MNATTTAAGKNHLISALIIGATLVLILFVGYDAWDTYYTNKTADVAQMATNHGLCKDYGCAFRSHDNNYDTPEQKAWYEANISEPRRKEAEHDACMKREALEIIAANQNKQ